MHVTRVLSLACILCLASCRSAPSYPPPPASSPSPAPESSPPAATPGREMPLAPVRVVSEELVVAAWAEPRALPAGGGLAHILVRVQKRNGKPYPGVEVRLAASSGTLYSGGGILVTDARGMTRDRLTTHRTASVTLNAGGTRYTFQVPVASAR